MNKTRILLVLIFVSLVLQALLPLVGFFVKNELTEELSETHNKFVENLIETHEEIVEEDQENELTNDYGDNIQNEIQAKKSDRSNTDLKNGKSELKTLKITISKDRHTYNIDKITTELIKADKTQQFRTLMKDIIPKTLSTTKATTMTSSLTRKEMINTFKENERKLDNDLATTKGPNTLKNNLIITILKKKSETPPKTSEDMTKANPLNKTGSVMEIKPPTIEPSTARVVSKVTQHSNPSISSRWTNSKSTKESTNTRKHDDGLSLDATNTGHHNVHIYVDTDEFEESNYDHTSDDDSYDDVDDGNWIDNDNNNLAHDNNDQKFQKGDVIYDNTRDDSLVGDKSGPARGEDHNLNSDNDDIDRARGDFDCNDNEAKQTECEVSSNKSSTSSKHSSTQTKTNSTSTTSKSTQKYLFNHADSQKHLENNLDHQMFADLIELVAALDDKKQLDGVILISKGEEFKPDTMIPEWENLTQIHLDHIPNKLELEGNLIRTLSIIIMDAHMRLLRGFSTGSRNFFEALQPTMAILIVLPNCDQQIRDNLSAFTLLHLWRLHGLYKIIVVCHRRYYPRKWRYSMKSREQSMETPEQPIVSLEELTPPEKQLESLEDLLPPEKLATDKPKISVIHQEKSFNKELRMDSEKQTNIRDQVQNNNNSEQESNAELENNKQFQEKGEQRTHDEEKSQQGNVHDEFSKLTDEIGKNKLLTFDEKEDSLYNKTRGKLSKLPLELSENYTRSTDNVQSKRRLRNRTSCKFLVWLFHPFKTCMKNRFDNKTLEILQQYFATIDPNLDALTGNGQQYLPHQPQFRPKLTFSANFQSFGTSDPEQRDDRFQKLQDRPNNMQGCQFYLSIYQRIPTAVIHTNPTRIEGLDGQIMNMLANRMNFTPNIQIGKDRIVYGMQGTFPDILNRNVDMNINGHFVKGYNESRLAFTRFITHDIVCLLTPKAPQVSPLETVLLSFHWPVWLALCFTFGILLSIYYVWWYVLRDKFIWKPARPLSSHAGSRILLELYRTMLNLPSSGIAVLSADYRLLLAVLYVFSFIVTNAFQGSLFTFISTPVYYPDLNTFSELDKSDLPLRTSSSGWDDLFKEDAHLENLGKRLEHWNESVIRTDPSHFVQFQRINTHWRHVFHDVRIRPLGTSNFTRTLF
ncbi:hypothetical protein WDU94_000518 [Cyamophila willieti]